jgi:hypothetical protein
LPPYCLCEHETIGKLILIVDRRSSCLSNELVNVPIPVPLKYTFASDSVLFENSIQTGFGGDRLITTVEDLNEVITNDGDFVTVKVYGGLVSFGIVGDFGVVFVPVQIVRNGVVHFTFDLTHESVLFDLKVVWDGLGGKSRGCVPPSQPSHPEELFKLICDTVDQPIGSVQIEHVANPIDAIVEVAEVATHEITKSGSDVQIELVDLRSSGVVHTDIIGTGSADLREAVDSAPTVHPRRPWV